MFSILRPFIFSLDPETAHDLAINSLKLNILPKNFFQVDNEKLLETNAAIQNMDNNAAGEVTNEDADDVENLTSQEKAELRKKCAALDDKPYGSVVSKYSGKTINVDHVGERDGDKLYIIKWQNEDNQTTTIRGTSPIQDK